jgi:predicted nucleic acid-binding protein
VARDWTVVTANTREFSRIEELNVIDWTVPAA